MGGSCFSRWWGLCGLSQEATRGPQPPEDGSLWKGLVGGISHIPRAFPKSHPGKIQGRQEARPKPTSCTGFLEGHDKEEEGATWRGGGCSEEGGQAGWGPNVANPALGQPCPAPALSSGMHLCDAAGCGELEAQPRVREPHTQGLFYNGEASRFAGQACSLCPQWESGPGR